MSVSTRRVPYLATAVLLLATMGAALFSSTATAAGPVQLTDRSLTLQDGATDGGSKPSGVVNHLFTFTTNNVAQETIGSIEFQYCTTADVDIGGSCTMPAGLTTTSATLGSPDGGFDSLVTSGSASSPGSNGMPYVTSAAGITVPAGGQTFSIQLSTVTNPNNTNCGGQENCTFYVRILTYQAASATGTALDAGTVAASTSTQIQLQGTMPESLIFCTGGTVNANCTSTTSGNVTFPMVFSPAAPAYTTSQLAASTNALSGYAITVSGSTLTSGSNTITAMTSLSASVPGTRQFGMNLAANTGAYSGGGDPNITGSSYVTPTSDGGDYMGSATANFNVGDPAIDGTTDQQSKFMFNDSALNTIAKSDNGANLNYVGNTPGPTNSQVYTASYLVNVSGNLPAGTYTTTLTYICTPTF